MNILKLQEAQVDFKVMIDTFDFMLWCCKTYRYDSDHWHKEIWDKMSDDFVQYKYVAYSLIEDPKNEFESTVNDFILEFGDFRNTVYFLFSN